MKSRFLKSILFAAIIVGGIWVLANRDKIDDPGDILELIKAKLASAETQRGSIADDDGADPANTFWSSYPAANPALNGQPSQKFITNVIRIASLRLDKPIADPVDSHSIEILADICRRYDVIAFQGINATDDNWLTQLTGKMNVMGSVGGTSQSRSPVRSSNSADYFFVSGSANPSNRNSQSAIVFNRRTLQLDSSQWYTVNDPDNILSREPQVALFRARGPSPDEAFTFTLVNIQLESRRADAELAYVSELFRAIRNDGRAEDDVLIVGNFNGGDSQLRTIQQQAGLTWVVSNQPTDTLHRAQSDNLVFSKFATIEFTGRGGVFDFMRHYNLRLDEALSVSQNMPVWGEFSIFEGHAPAPSITPGTLGRTARGQIPAPR